MSLRERITDTVKWMEERIIDTALRMEERTNSDVKNK